MRKYTFLSCLLVSMIGAKAQDTSRVSVLDSVTFTSSVPNKTLLYQPVSISRLNRTELQRGTGLFLDDAIQTNVTGVIMNRRTVSGGQQLNIRGYGNGARGTRGPSSNFDGQGYKVYLNGIAVTDAEGITTFDDIDFGSLQNVEIVKGPAGTLYGLAIAGAMNLTTAKAEKNKTSVSQQVMLGNYGLKRFTTTLQHGAERSSILLNYGNQRSDGFLLHNASEKQFVNFVGDFYANEKQTINTYFGYSDSYDERAGELTIAQYDANDYSGNPEYIKRNAHSNVVTFRAGVGHNYVFNNWLSNSTTIFGTAFNSNVSSAGGWTDKGAMNYGLRSVFNTKFPVAKGVMLSGVTGVETQRQQANTLGYNMKKNPNDTTTNWTLGKSPYWVINTGTSNVFTLASTTSLFTEWTLALPKDLTISAGVGVSNMMIKLDDRFNTATATKPSLYDTSYKNMVSPHVAINKVFSKKLSLFASYSKGYKAPVSSYFYITVPTTPATGRVNNVLKPEVGNQFEIGTRGEILNNKLSYELILFHTTFSNKMVAVAVSNPATPNTTLYSYMVNGGKQIHKGIEAMVRYNAFESYDGFVQLVRPFANITYSDFTYGDNFKFQKSPVLTEDYSNKQVAAVPKYVFNAGVDVLLAHGIYANATYNYRDKQAITSMNDVYAGSYNLLNAKVGMQKTVTKHLSFDASFGINNITNAKYYLMVFANQLPDAYIPAPTRANYFGNVQLKYTF